MYTATEGFARLLMMHVACGDDPSAFQWRDWVSPAAEMEPVSRAGIFQPSPELAATAAEIVSEAVFTTVQKSNPNKNSVGTGSAQPSRYVGFQLKRRQGGTTGYQFRLSPFAVRLTREESALRLALDAGAAGVHWGLLAMSRTRAGGGGTTQLPVNALPAPNAVPITHPAPAPPARVPQHSVRFVDSSPIDATRLSGTQQGMLSAVCHACAFAEIQLGCRHVVQRVTRNLYLCKLSALRDFICVDVDEDTKPKKKRGRPRRPSASDG